MPSTTKAKYTLIPGQNKHPNSSTSQPWLRTLLFFLAFTTMTVLSFLLGRYSVTTTTSITTVASIETDKKTDISFPKYPQTFIYNRTFAEGTHRADESWKSLFPKQAGYFSHPDIADGHRSTLSVYHYLHCLNGIREGYWAIYDIATDTDSDSDHSSTSETAGHQSHGHDEEEKNKEERKKKMIETTGKTASKKIEIDNLPMMISPSHVRHCIDLLRQNLMCNADLTVEVKDDEAGGVHGFGTTHQCVDWEELGGWVGKWEHRRN